ncbi:MAG: hypothetical protein ACK4P3_08590 [Fimbriimonadaceae bacterium]
MITRIAWQMPSGGFSVQWTTSRAKNKDLADDRAMRRRSKPKARAHRDLLSFLALPEEHKTATK